MHHFHPPAEAGGFQWDYFIGKPKNLLDDKNLTDYKDTIAEILHCNAFIILSNGTDSRVGTITSRYHYFLEWKRINEADEGVVTLDTLLRGTCAKTRLLDIVENFLLFDGSGTSVAKIMAKNHQYLGVNKVVNRSRNGSSASGVVK